MDGSPSRGRKAPTLVVGAPVLCQPTPQELERTNQDFSAWTDPCHLSLGETIPIRLFLGGFDLTPTFRDVNKKFSTRYFLSLVLIDEGKQEPFLGMLHPQCTEPASWQSTTQTSCCWGLSFWFFLFFTFQRWQTFG